MWPKDAKELKIENATVPFFAYVKDGHNFIGFDTSMCVPPEPMVNAMVALESLCDADTSIVMINHRSPVGLLAKVKDFYDIATEELGEGKVKLTFTHLKGKSEKADLSKKSCAG
ncbi:MAG: hypothetical protein PHN38_07210 [Sulfurospirillaceae bacterium]|nr:hypothetical protein [Sulfurospirillaceae bacterium]MDD3463828.1 hypothetical protein [Sulfurospirillaceae bacterium]